MRYVADGTLFKIFEAEEKSASFLVREFVIKIADGKYSQSVKFQLLQDHCALIDSFTEGDDIRVNFELRGREWNGKYFTNLHAVAVEKIVSAGDFEKDVALYEQQSDVVKKITFP